MSTDEIKLIQKRDDRATTLLFNSYSKVIKSAIKKRIDNADEADDIFCDIFEHITKNISKYTPITGDRAEFCKWLITVTNNKCLDYLRSREREQKRFQDFADEYLATNTEYEEQIDDDPYYVDDAAKTVKGLLKDTPFRYKIFLEKVYLDGMTHKECGKYLNISQREVNSALERAKRYIRKKSKTK